MTKLFDVLPGWLWALALSGVIAAYVVTGRQLEGERTGHLKTQLAHETLVAAAEAARADEEVKRRNTEKELTNAFEIQTQEVIVLRHRADASRAAAVAAAGRLRDATQAAAERARAQCADPATAELRAPAGDPIGVLGRVLGEIDNYAGVLAEHADRSRIAGLACEKLYDSVRSAVRDGE
jgi:hypothetical protein